MAGKVRTVRIKQKSHSTKNSEIKEDGKKFSPQEIFV